MEIYSEGGRYGSIERYKYTEGGREIWKYRDINIQREGYI